jgi:hypothetical protein
MELKFRYRIRKISLVFPAQSQMNPVPAFTFSFFKIYFNILVYTPSLSCHFFPFWLVNIKLCVHVLSFCMLDASSISLFYKF